MRYGGYTSAESVSILVLLSLIFEQKPKVIKSWPLVSTIFLACIATTYEQFLGNYSFFIHFDSVEMSERRISLIKRANAIRSSENFRHNDASDAREKR